MLNNILNYFVTKKYSLYQVLMVWTTVSLFQIGMLWIALFVFLFGVISETIAKIHLDKEIDSGKK